MDNNQNPWYGINPEYLSELALCPSIGLAGCSNTMESFENNQKSLEKRIGELSRDIKTLHGDLEDCRTRKELDMLAYNTNMNATQNPFFRRADENGSGSITIDEIEPIVKDLCKKDWDNKKDDGTGKIVPSWWPTWVASVAKSYNSRKNPARDAAADDVVLHPLPS